VTIADLPLQTTDQWRDLAPQIHRQRLVVEGAPARTISDVDIRTYLAQLAEVTAMIPLMDPVTHSSPTYGWAGWTHWETSGAHFYAWDQPQLFFSVDIYTCKPFDSDEVVEFTREFFGASEITWKAF
jgi:S-adenosylmethionine decarboxylase